MNQPKASEVWRSAQRVKTSEHPHLCSLTLTMGLTSQCDVTTCRLSSDSSPLLSFWHFSAFGFTPHRSGLWGQHLSSRSTFKHMARARLSKQSLQRRFNYKHRLDLQTSSNPMFQWFQVQSWRSSEKCWNSPCCVINLNRAPFGLSHIPSRPRPYSGWTV